VKVTKDKVENSQAFLTVEMEPEETEEALGRAYRKLVKKANIPGFRKGKAPRAIVEQFLGKESLLEEAINIMIPEAYDKAVKEQELKPVAMPEIDLVKAEPVTFKATVPLQPTVKLGDYHQVRVSQESIQLKEEEVDDVVEKLRHQHATWDSVDRPADYNDSLTLDIESNVGEQAFINQKGAQYQILKDSQFPLKGFAENLIGMKAEDTKEFKLQFPEDYGQAELAGKEAEFKIKVTEVKEEKPPELNEEFAKKINPEVKDIAELREKIADTLKQQKEAKAKADYQRKVIDATVETAGVEFPSVMVEQEIDQLINEQMRRWQMNEKGLDEYLKSIKKTTEELRNEIRPAATRRVKDALVLDRISEEEKIEATDAEIDTEIETMTKDIKERREELVVALNNPQSRRSIADVIISRKTLEKLVDIASAPAESTENTEKKEDKS